MPPIGRRRLILIFHPNWWGQPPAILKGWIDRVFRLGVAYDYPPDVGPEGAPTGLLRATCGLVFNTSNTPWEREVAVFGNRFRDYGRLAYLVCAALPVSSNMCSGRWRRAHLNSVLMVG